MIAIADTGFVLAVGNPDDRRHPACVAAYHQQISILLPQSTLAEIAYMLTRQGGNRLLTQFLKQLPTMKYRWIALEQADLERTTQLLEQYADARLDFVDATIAAVAERLDVRRILTIDARDFLILRPQHVEYFEILPSFARRP